MQACRVPRRLPATGASTSYSLPRTIRLGAPRRHSDHRRSFASAAVGKSQILNQPEQSSARKRISELLQKTISLLPLTLSTAHGAVGPESSVFWSSVLEESFIKLSSGSDQVPSKATIAVCGFDKWACSHDLVTALLEDPFTSDPTYTDILRSRWKGTPSHVNIEYGKPSAFDGGLSSPSNWLQQFPYATRLTEFPDLSSMPGVSNETDNLLMNSDVLLLLCDPVLTPLSDLAIRAKHLLNKPNTILILTSGSSPHHQFVSRTLFNAGCQPGHILFVDPRQALDAVTALQANPTSPSTIDRYQRDTLGSRISTVAVAVDEILRPKNLSEASLLDVRYGTAFSQVHSSLSASYRSVEATEKDIDRVTSRVDDLSSEVARVRENTRQDILGKPGEDNEIKKALSLGAKEMGALLGFLTFWRMVWRVDEIGALVSTAVQRQWCKRLQDQLILQTGCLEFTRRELSVSAFGLLSAASSTPLRSPVLENHLQQLKRSPTHVLTPSSLIQPIHDRRSQLIQYTTSKLHREAQSAILGAFGGVLSGAGLGWWLVFGEHILGLGPGTEIGTAVGSGALLAVGSIRWAVGKWERAKQRWTQDSERIGQGLSRDLERTIQQTVEENVTIIASTACKGMQDLIDRRRNETHQLHRKLHDLDAELRACAQFPASWTGQGLHSVKEVDVE